MDLFYLGILILSGGSHVFKFVKEELFIMFTCSKKDVFRTGQCMIFFKHANMMNSRRRRLNLYLFGFNTKVLPMWVNSVTHVSEQKCYPCG
jgi:hypothetical protein